MGEGRGGAYERVGAFLTFCGGFSIFIFARRAIRKPCGYRANGGEGERGRGGRGGERRGEGLMRELERFLVFVMVFQFSFLLAGLYESHVDTKPWHHTVCMQCYIGLWVS